MRVQLLGSARDEDSQLVLYAAEANAYVATSVNPWRLRGSNDLPMAHLALPEREIINRLGHRSRSVLARVVTQSTKTGVELLLIQAGEHRVRACRYPCSVVWPARRYLLNDLADDGAAEARRPKHRANLRGGRKATLTNWNSVGEERRVGIGCHPLAHARPHKHRFSWLKRSATFSGHHAWLREMVVGHRREDKIHRPVSQWDVFALTLDEMNVWTAARQRQHLG